MVYMDNNVEVFVIHYKSSSRDSRHDNSTPTMDI